MKYSFLSVTAALAVLTLTGCQHEELTVNNPAGNDILNFSVGFAGSGEIVLTKGATLTSQDGAVSIPLSCTVTDGIEANLPEAAVTRKSASATKGTQINSESEFLGAELTSFTAAGWNADKTEFIPSSTAVSYSDGKWRTAATYGWRGSDNKTFLAYANLPSSGATVLNSVDPVKQTFTYTVPTDARQQNDIMLGWYEGDGGGTATAAITMVHPLTAIVFKMGEIDASVTAIKSISISGVYTSGTADVTYALSDGDIIPTYDWKAGTGADTRTGSQTVTLSPAGEATELEVAAAGKIGTSFIILPQTVAAGALTLRINVTKDGDDAVLAASVPAGQWQEGKTNTFTIGYEKPLGPLLPGLISVSPEKQVQFARGNLYYNGSTYEFEANQYGHVENGAFNASHVAHFYWSKDATAARADTYSDIGFTSADVFFTNATVDTPKSDFTVNGETGKYRILSAPEWQYALFTRTVNGGTGLGKTHSVDIIYGGIGGMVIYPDNYTGAVLSGTVSELPEGVVFLPLAGERDGVKGIFNVNNGHGFYWSSSFDSGTLLPSAFFYQFYAGLSDPYSSHTVMSGNAIRMVADYEAPLPPELLPGIFSVSISEYVQFSRGNLYCTRSGSEGSYTYDFGLEQHQFDFHTRPEGPSVINGVYDEEGTAPNMSGHFYWDIAKAQAGKDYGAFSTTAPSGGTTSDVLDWGPALDAASHWTTLSSTDWNYLVKIRKVKSATGLGNTCQFVIVKGVNGLIIYPDDYDGEMFTNQQEITAIPYGCVFIPMAGEFTGGKETYVTERCNYWTSSAGTEGGNAYNLTAYGTNLVPNHLLSRANGLSVRLVQKKPKVDYVEIAGLKWATENLAITESGKKEWKGTGHIVGDYFQWGAYAGYCGDVTDVDKGLVLYESFTCKGCGDTADQFTMKVGKKFNTAFAPFNKGTSPYPYLGYVATPATLASEHDAANIVLGGKWRMPTTGEIVAMRNATYWVWDDTDKGYYICSPSGTCEAGGQGNAFPTGTDKTDALLFIPASGYAKYGPEIGNRLFQSTIVSDIWSSSLNEQTNNAYNLYFGGTGADPIGILPGYNNSRYMGFSIRPVADK